MTQRTLAESLAAYADSDYYPFHMPGHKRRLTETLPDFPEALQRAARLDITEIDGFDNLHDPEGILKDAEEKAAALYGADRCYYSVNGSTAGLLTAISAAVPEGGKLILARNCHKAVYHSIYLRRLTPVYLYPDIVPGTSLAGTLTKEQIEAALIQNPDASAVLLTSPTYDGRHCVDCRDRSPVREDFNRRCRPRSTFRISSGISQKSGRTGGRSDDRKPS